MKKLTLALLLIASIASAQKIAQPLSAGDQLVKAKNHFYTGVGLVAFGTLISTVPLLTGETNIEDKKPMIIMGGIFELIGAVFTIESFSHIGKAGNILNSQNKSLTISPMGASFKMRF